MAIARGQSLGGGDLPGDSASMLSSPLPSLRGDGEVNAVLEWLPIISSGVPKIVVVDGHDKTIGFASVEK
jgi:hypothetical protein